MPLPIDVIAILPVQPAGPDGIEAVRGLLEAQGIRVIEQPPILRPRGAYDAQRHQYRAEVLLERARLIAMRPVLVVTDADCYAGDLNFVFGIAEFAGGLALVSLYRLRERATHARLRQRIATEMLHELGHALGLPHCHSAKCVMRFSNSLAQADAKGEEFCPACLRRLHEIRIPRHGQDG